MSRGRHPVPVSGPYNPVPAAGVPARCRHEGCSAISTITAYRGLLSNRPLIRLFAGEFVSGIGDWLYLVALLIVVYNVSSDPLVLGIVGGARVLPYVFLSVPAGVIVDRYDRRLVLLVTDVARGLIMVALTALVLVDGPLIAIVGLAIFATCFSTFFRPTIGAYVPMLVRDERELGPANSLFATLGELSFIIGPALAGIIVAVTNPGVAFAINAATFAVVATVLATLPPGRTHGAATKAAETAGHGVDPVSGTAGDEAAQADGEAAPAPAATASAAPPIALESVAGLRSVARPLIGLMTLDVVGGFMFGGLSVLTVLLAVDRLGAGESATGFLNAAVGVGGVLGALGSGALVLRRNLAPPMVGGALLLAAGFIALGVSTALLPALVAMAVIAGGALIADVVETTVFQRLVPDELRGRVLGGMQMMQTFTYAAGSLLLPVLVSTVGAWIILPIGGAAILVAAVIALTLLGNNLRQAADPAADVMLRVSRLPLFAGVPATALQAAAARLEPVPVTAGTVVIREGDPADRFYLIQTGRFAVDQLDRGTGVERRLRVMGPDEVFGELGLMHQAPRSATVTAETDAQLLALSGPAFLELVGSAADLSARLTDRYRGAGTSSS